MSSAPDKPYYDAGKAKEEQRRLNTTAATQQYADVNSPLGSYTTSYDPVTGQTTVNTSLDENSKAALQKHIAALGSYNPNDVNQANEYYQAKIAYLQPQLDRQTARTNANLIQRGVSFGSNAYNNAMTDLQNEQNQQIAGLSNEAINKGQGYYNNIINQSSNLINQVRGEPNMVEGAGGAGLQNTYNQQYQNDIERYKTAMAKRNAAFSTVGGIGGAILGGLVSGGAGAVAGYNVGSNFGTLAAV